MADIWSGIGVNISSSPGGDEWLYRVGDEMRGPVPFKVVVQKLVAGELNVNTPVAKEGGEFHPIARVAAFAPHVTEAKKQAQKRTLKRIRRLALILALPALAALAGGGYIVYQGYQRALAAKEAERRAAENVLAERRKREAAAPQMKLAALVSLGSEEDVKIHQNPAGKKPSGHSRTRSHTESEPDTMVQQCQLSQAQILGTLRKHLGKINVCVEDEKSRDTQGLLPPSLSLEFVVQTSGKVTEFAINDRHYRKGPLNNCMIKAFKTISFPSSTGANCPVTIPIKIGK